MNKIDKENLYLLTPKDEELANRTVAWYEKESAANHGFKIFFLPLIKLGFLLLLYIICAFVFKGLAWGYWFFVLLGAITILFYGLSYLPFLGANLLFMKLRFFFEARKDVEKIIAALIQTKSQVTDEELFAFARIEYSLGLLDSAESLLKQLIEKDTANQKYRDLSVEIIARRKAMLPCKTTSKSKGCCCK